MMHAKDKIADFFFLPDRPYKVIFLVENDCKHKNKWGWPYYKSLKFDMVHNNKQIGGWSKPNIHPRIQFHVCDVSFIIF